MYNKPLMLDWTETSVTFTFPSPVSSFQVTGLDFDYTANDDTGETIGNFNVSPTSTTNATNIGGGFFAIGWMH